MGWVVAGGGSPSAFSGHTCPGAVALDVASDQHARQREGSRAQAGIPGDSDP